MLSLISCASHVSPKTPYNQFVEVFQNVDGTINELSGTSGSDALNTKLNSAFQSISENAFLNYTDPQSRVQQKSNLLEHCIRSLDDCNYVPEGYTINTHRHLLNIEYQYNAFSSYDTYYKHAVIDLKLAERVTGADIFTAPEDILALYNTKYVKENQNYLNQFDIQTLDEDQEWEFEVIRDHLNTRVSFKLADLNNLELTFDADETLTEIRFHYNGLGGSYKSILPAGYIAFNVTELENLLTQDFKPLLKPPTLPRP